MPAFVHQIPRKVLSIVPQHGFHAILERVFRRKVGVEN